MFYFNIWYSLSKYGGAFSQILYCVRAHFLAVFLKGVFAPLPISGDENDSSYFMFLSKLRDLCAACLASPNSVEIKEKECLQKCHFVTATTDRATGKSFCYLTLKWWLTTIDMLLDDGDQQQFLCKVSPSLFKYTTDLLCW